MYFGDLNVKLKSHRFFVKLPTQLDLEGHLFSVKTWLYMYWNQARSQGEVRKPELQHHMGIDTRNLDFS